MIRLLIADDQALVRQGLASLLSLQVDFEIAGEAANGQEALEMVKSLHPDVVLMDIRMPVVDGVAATEAIAGLCPQTKIIVLTTYDDDEYIVKAMQAGAAAYLLKDCPWQEVASAVRSVHKGYTQLGPTIQAKVLARLSSRVDALRKSKEAMFTARELEVLKLLAQGMSSRQIARTLLIAERTVNNHVSHILARLNLRDRTQAALWAKNNLE